MQALVERDYFTDPEILSDPYAYFREIQKFGPVYRDPKRDIVFVTGFAELVEVLRNTRDFSAANATTAASVPLPFDPVGPDISAEIEEHRTEFLAGDMLTSLDGEAHSFRRALVVRLFTPARLRANHDYIQELCRTLIGDAVARGGCDVIADIAQPLATLVIANLLGVPDEDRKIFREALAAAPPTGAVSGEHDDNPFIIMSRHFAGYVMDRRANPRDDVISELANSRFPDGTMPPPEEIVKLGVFIFGAGQDTTVKLIGNAMRYLVETPGLQAELRANRALIPQMIEEVLRLQGVTKCNARMAKRDTKIGGVPIKAGTQVVTAFAAANRDSRRWDAPDEFRLDRQKINEHLAFSRGAHVCAGAPLARLESRIAFETFLELTSHIDLDEGKHGPPGARTLEYEPSFILRGFAELFLKLS